MLPNNSSLNELHIGKNNQKLILKYNSNKKLVNLKVNLLVYLT